MGDDVIDRLKRNLANPSYGSSTDKHIWKLSLRIREQSELLDECEQLFFDVKPECIDWRTKERIDEILAKLRKEKADE